VAFSPNVTASSALSSRPDETRSDQLVRLCDGDQHHNSDLRPCSNGDLLPCYDGDLLPCCDDDLIPCCDDDLIPCRSNYLLTEYFLISIHIHVN
jgi:hypothetical protein